MSGNCELGRGLRRRDKNPTEAGAGRFEKPAPDARAAPPKAHESLISRKTVAEVPLTGLSFLVEHVGLHAALVLVIPAAGAAAHARHDLDLRLGINAGKERLVERFRRIVADAVAEHHDPQRSARGQPLPTGRRGRQSQPRGAAGVQGMTNACVRFLRFSPWFGLQTRFLRTGMMARAGKLSRGPHTLKPPAGAGGMTRRDHGRRGWGEWPDGDGSRHPARCREGLLGQGGMFPSPYGRGRTAVDAIIYRSFVRLLPILTVPRMSPCMRSKAQQPVPSPR